MSLVTGTGDGGETGILGGSRVGEGRNGLGRAEPEVIRE